MEKKIRKFTDSKLTRELAFAKGFASAPPVSVEEKRWLEALEREVESRRVEPLSTQQETEK